METSVRTFFERYEHAFNDALHGDVGMDDIATLYAAEFIAASPAGVMTGKNDAQLKQAMAQGYAHYRSIGTKAMRLRDLRILQMDEHHCVAHATWRATYAREAQPGVEIDFDVHYLVQQLDAEPKVFGWVSGDEQALLKAHGVI